MNTNPGFYLLLKNNCPLFYFALYSAFSVLRSAGISYCLQACIIGINLKGLNFLNLLNPVVLSSHPSSINSKNGAMYIP